MYEIMWVDNIKSVPKNSTFEGILYHEEDDILKPYKKWKIEEDRKRGTDTFIVYNRNTAKEVKLASLEQYESAGTKYYPEIDIIDDIGHISLNIKKMRTMMRENVDYFYHFRGVEKDTLCIGLRW